MHGANQNPHAYGLVDAERADGQGKTHLLPRQELSVAQKAANFCYANPFKMVGESFSLCTYVCERARVRVLPAHIHMKIEL